MQIIRRQLLKTVVGEYLLGRDFTEVSTGKYELTTPIRVDDCKSTYTVVETLHTVNGFDVSVSYSIDGGNSQNGETAVLRSVSDDADNPTTVAYANDYTDAPGYINITKTIQGDVTEEDLRGLTFKVKDGETVVGEYLLGRDFTEVSTGVYELTTPIRVDDCKKTYTVEETLHTVEGFDVSVNYTINGGTPQNGNTATLDSVSQDSNNPTTVAYANDYTDAPGDSSW